MKKRSAKGMVVAGLLALACVFAAPVEADAFLLTFSGGLKGGVTGSAAQGAGKTDRIQATNGSEYTLVPNGLYPMFGAGGAFGLVLEARAMDFIGIETGFYYSRDNGSGWNDFLDGSGNKLARISQEQATTAYHIPLLLKANIPGPLLRPFLGVGVEFVRQSSSELTYTEDVSSTMAAQLQARNEIVTSNYTVLLATVGMDLKFGSVRIPIEVRAGYNLGFDKSLRERATYEAGNPGKLTYNGKYQGHVGLFTGFVYDFDLLL